MIATILAGTFAALWITWVVLWISARGRTILAERRANEYAEASNAASRSESKAIELAAREKRRADQQFKVIEDATRETAATWTLYRKQSIEAGNAQAWLFRELGNLVNAYNRLAKAQGKPPYTIPKRLQGVIDTYREEHMSEEKAKENQEAIVREEQERAKGVMRDHGA